MTHALRGDALHVPLRDSSVDLIVTSPPYFALRSYRDGDEHYDGQIGSEDTPQLFLEALWAVMKECWRVLKPEGNCFINLGDKRSGSGAPGTTSGLTGRRSTGTPIPGQAKVQGERSGIVGGYNQAAIGRRKSRMMLPERFAIGCMDGLADPEGIGWIVRQVVIWQKPNGLPESVTDRTRDNFEFVFHLVKSERYFSAVDEIREAHAGPAKTRGTAKYGDGRGDGFTAATGWAALPSTLNPLGALPGSVWSIPSEPLRIPEWAKEKYDLPDHFAAFPTELPRRLILGFSPAAVCEECGEGRRPVVDKANDTQGRTTNGPRSTERRHESPGREVRTVQSVAVIGYSCSCPEPTADTTPGVVLDPFGGTGTTAMVAKALGRTGISLDLSHSYSRLADWRIHESGHAAKAIGRTAKERQGTML